MMYVYMTIAIMFWIIGFMSYWALRIAYKEVMNILEEKEFNEGR